MGADLAALVLLLGGGVGPVEDRREEQPRLDGVLNRLARLASLEPLGVDGGVVAVVVVPRPQQAHAAGAGCTRTQTKAPCTVGYGTLRGYLKRGLEDMGSRCIQACPIPHVMHRGPSYHVELITAGVSCMRASIAR